MSTDRRTRLGARAWVHLSVAAVFFACGGSVSDESAPAGRADGDGVVSCGKRACDLQTGALCCGVPSAPVCAATCSDTTDQLRCDGPEDCPGRKCCSHLTAKGVSEAICADSCVWGRDFTVCHTNEHCAGQPHAGPICCPFNEAQYPGVGFCEDRCH